MCVCVLLFHWCCSNRPVADKLRQDVFGNWDWCWWMRWVCYVRARWLVLRKLDNQWIRMLFVIFGCFVAFQHILWTTFIIMLDGERKKEKVCVNVCVCVCVCVCVSLSVIISLYGWGYFCVRWYGIWVLWVFFFMLCWMFQHDCLDTYCFECLLNNICMCFIFLYKLFSAIEHVSHGKAL